MNGLSLMKRTASTSMSIFAVSSAITFLSGKPVIDPLFSSPFARGGQLVHTPAVAPQPVSPPRTGARKSTGHHLPLDGLTAAIDQRALVRAGHDDLDRPRPGRFFQRDGILVRRQPIMLGSVERRKDFELV